MTAPETDERSPKEPHDATFLSYSRQDAAFAIRLAEGLRDRDVRLWVDLWNIAPGSDWDRAIDRALWQCARFLIVLSPAAVASEEVRGELRTALNSRKPIVPVLCRPCEIPRRLQHIQFVDFTADRSSPDELLDTLAHVLRAATQAPADVSAAPEPSPAPPEVNGEPPGQTAYRTRRDLRNRNTLLKDVRSEVKGRLARARHGGSPIAIRLEWQPDRVQPPWDVDLKMARPGPTAPPPPGIVDAFDAPTTGGRLLILGGPGSGKTTALLQLADALIARAHRSFDEPVPVLFSLSSWKGPRTTLGDWLVHQLKQKYGVREDLGAQWRDEGGLVPLLDGLDELPSGHQDACVQALNAFQQTHRPPQLVVCCRVDEYLNLATPLQLNAAVHLLPLSDQQIHDHLVGIEQPLVWEGLREGTTTLELARSPLLLDLMASIGADHLQQARVEDAATTSAASRLFEAYVDALLTREQPTRRYSSQDARHWLAQLASTLARHGQSAFLLEGLQASWLRSRGQLWAYRVGVMLATVAVVATIAVGADWITRHLPRGPLGTALYGLALTSPLLGAALMVGAGLAVAILIASRPAIIPVETVTWSWTNARRGAAHWARRSARNGLDYGFAGAAAVGATIMTLDMSGLWPLVRVPEPPLVTVSEWQRAGRLVGIALGVFGAIGVASIVPSGWVVRPTLARTFPRATNALLTGAVAALLVTLTGSDSLLVALAVVTIVPLVGLSRAFTPASRLAFVNALIAALIGAPVAAMIASLRGPLPSSSITWLNALSLIGLFCGLTAGLLSAVRARLPGRADAHDRDDPSMRALARSWRRAAGLGVAIGLAGGGVAAAVSWLGHGWLLRGLTLFALHAEGAFFIAVGAAFMFAGGLGVGVAIGAGLLGGLAGLLSGVSGPDVLRRRVPNQGIQQSARNITTFAAIGMVAVGIPYAVFNIVTGALATQTWPSGADWLRIGVNNMLLFGLLAGLIPGAACLQHYTLRFVLWWTRMAPWRYADFLDFATDRRLLQRIGGRYRFMHMLLRDHFAGLDTTAAAPAAPASVRAPPP